MITTNSLVREIAAVEDTVFEFIGIPAAGFAVNITNTDLNNNLTYKFQQSNDGSTWTDVVFSINNCTSTASTFVITPEHSHNVKVTTTMGRMRLRAYGSLTALVTLNYVKETAVASNQSVTINY